MKQLTIVIFCFACIYLSACNQEPTENEQEKSTSKPDSLVLDEKKQDLEIVFCLDATGSMSGLISTAKEKIWSIVTNISQDTPQANVRLGMVFYRDRGDSFVTQQIPLTSDIDSVYDILLKMTANGGGDSPESVNQALNEAVTSSQWTLENDVFKTIFVVGDCAPHMDYKDDTPYTKSCLIAQEKGIVINTIKLGRDCGEAIPHFKAMSECSHGEYLNIGQNAEDIVINTPYDEEIQKLSLKIERSKKYYGSKESQAYNNTRKDKALSFYDNASSYSNVERSKYNMSKSGNGNWMGENELVNDFDEGKLELDKLKKEDLPEEYKGKSETEIENILQKTSEERKITIKEMRELQIQRDQFIASENKKHKGKESFSSTINKILEKQKGGK